MRYDVSFLVNPDDSGLVAYLAHSNGGLAPPYQYKEGIFYRQDYIFHSQKSIYNFLKAVDKRFGLENEHVFKLLCINDPNFKDDKGDEKNDEVG